MTKFGLVVDNLESEESREIWDEAQGVFESTVLINNFSELLIILEQNSPPKILLGTQNISDINVLMIRSSKHNKVAKSVLAHTFNNLECNIVDPLDRFPVGFASKLSSTITRHNRGCIIDTYLSFSHNSTINLICYLSTKADHKLFIKPINSSQNRGAQKINTLQELEEVSYDFGYLYRGDIIPLYIQKYIEIEKEYRIFVLNGEVIASMKKRRREDGSIKYIKKRFRRLAEFVVGNVSPIGILGVDACKDINGNFYIIEANRSPMFRALENRTKINVAHEILTKLNGR